MPRAGPGMTAMFEDLLSGITRATETAPRRLAVECHDGSLDYGTLLAGATAVARQLRAIKPGSARVAIVANDDTLTYVGLLGIWMAGAAYVPLNTANPVRRNIEILSQAKVGAVISSTDFPPARQAAQECECAWWTIEPGPRRHFPIPTQRPLAAEDPAYILFTSGSTGRPKGVQITHGNISAFRDAWQNESAYRLSASDRVLQMFELGFDLSVMNIFIPWSVGASVHVVPHKGISYLSVLRLMQEASVTVTMMVPSVLTYLSRFFDEVRLPTVRYNMFCGEALPQTLVAAWSKCVPNALIENTYGPTEATIFCYTYRWDEATSARQAWNGIVPIGRPIGDTTGLILDDAGMEITGDGSGELYLSGPQLAKGYWNDPERSAAAFFTITSDNTTRFAYRTGDLVSRLPDGNLVWRGRVDHQIKIDGHRIELAEIEAHVREASDCTAVAAVAKQMLGGNTRLIVYVEGGESEPAALAAALAQRLPTYMCPHEVRRLPSLPLNVNGKIDRNKLATQ